MSVRIQKNPINVAKEWELFAAHSCEKNTGAVVSFFGCVRQEPKLLQLTIEHYPGMAEREIQRCCQKAHKRWKLNATRIVHRVGTLKPGEIIVLVMTAAPHRHDSFEAAQFLMDMLKTHAPFWKREDIHHHKTTHPRVAHPRVVHRWIPPHPKDQKALNRW